MKTLKRTKKTASNTKRKLRKCSCSTPNADAIYVEMMAENATSHMKWLFFRSMSCHSGTILCLFLLSVSAGNSQPHEHLLDSHDPVSRVLGQSHLSEYSCGPPDVDV